MSISKNYPRWIEGLTKEQFDELIKVFIHIHFEIDVSAIVDGPGDGGIDIKIFENKRSKKIPLQITVERTVYGKLERDLAKIEKLVINHGYQPNFHFFFSGGASEVKETDLIEIAEKDFDINLTIYDAQVIGGYIQNPKYALVREKLKQLLGSIFDDTESYFDQYDIMKFDMIAYGSDSMELKKIFVESFILHRLFSSENHTMQIESLITEVKKVFGQIDSDYCKRQIEILRSKQKVIYQGALSKHISLSEVSKDALLSILDEVSLQEKEYIFSIEKIIEKHNISSDKTTLIELIKEVLKVSYLKHHKEIEMDSSYTNGDYKALLELRKFLSDHVSDPESVEIIAFELRELSKKNDFLQKICAGEMYKGLINNSEFESYQRRIRKSIIIDTPVLLHLLCAFYDKAVDYPNNRYSVACHLFNLIRQSSGNLDFITTDKYIEETSNQLFNAVKLIPFIDIGIFEQLGGSNNTFYQFFDYLKNYNGLEISFAEFLSDFGFNYETLNDEQLKTYLDEKVALLFKDNYVDIITLHDYKKDPQCREDFEEIRKELEMVYLSKKINRSYSATSNDSLMLCYIYDEDLPVGEELVDPTLLTWDGVFADFRKNYYRIHPGKKHWHLFRPSKFLDHNSLLNFRINAEALSNDLLSITQDEFDLKEKMQSLNETLAKIADLRTAEGTRLSKGLAEIRTEFIYDLKGEDVEKSVFTETQPVDELVRDVSIYYSSKKSKFSFDDFKSALMSSDFLESFLNIIISELSFYKEKQKFTKNIKKNMDDLIEKFNQDKS